MPVIGGAAVFYQLHSKAGQVGGQLIRPETEGPSLFNGGQVIQQSFRSEKGGGVFQHFPVNISEDDGRAFGQFCRQGKYGVDGFLLQIVGDAFPDQGRRPGEVHTLLQEEVFQALPVKIDG